MNKGYVYQYTHNKKKKNNSINIKNINTFTKARNINYSSLKYLLVRNNCLLNNNMVSTLINSESISANSLIYIL